MFQTIAARRSSFASGIVLPVHVLAVHVLACHWLTIGSANARPFRTEQTPNGAQFRCALCHGGAGGARNVFGQAVEATLDGSNVDWSAVYFLDADGDGFTNGEELGDPLGEWRIGQPHPPAVATDPVNPFWSPRGSGAAPEVMAPVVAVDEDESVADVIVAVDPDSPELYFRIVTAPEHGQVVLDGRTGGFDYAPVGDYNGPDRFEFVVFDGGYLTPPITARIDVRPVNDPPRYTGPVRASVDEGQPIALTLTSDDIDGDVPTFFAVDGPHGSPDGITPFEVGPVSGEVSWIPSYDFVRRDEGRRSFGVRIGIDDGSGADDGIVFGDIEIEVRHANRSPTAPSLHEPVDGYVGAPARLVVNNASDPDGDPVTYRFELARDAGFDDLEAEWHVAERPDRTSVFIATALDENRSYWWRARADDGVVAGPSTGLARLVHSARNDPPGTPAILAPAGRVNDPNDLRFEWADTTDPEGETVTYEIEIYRADGRFAGGTHGIEPDPPRTIAAIDIGYDEDTDYWWQARAVDRRGLAGDWSAPLAFRVDLENTPPPIPVPVAPPEAARVPDLAALVLVATGVVDPDGDPITYGFRLSIDPAFERAGPAAVIAESGDVEAGPDGNARWRPAATGLSALTENRVYYWDVRARDRGGDGPAAWSSIMFDAVLEAPGAPIALSPAEGEVIGTTSPTLRWINPRDPEGDSLTYEVEIFADAELVGRQFARADISAGGGPFDVTAFEVVGLFDDHPAWWRVRAVDTAGQIGPWSGAVGFEVRTGNDPPSTPIPETPLRGAEFAVGEPIRFEWRNARDPEGDRITHDLEVFTADDRRRLEVAVPQSDGALTHHDLDDGLSAGDYDWRVRARDDDRAHSAWSDSMAFRVVGAPAPDADPGDAGEFDTGPEDAGEPDAGAEPNIVDAIVVSDAAPEGDDGADGGVSDAEPGDVEPGDAEPGDAGADTAISDAEPSDAETGDAEPDDAELEDAASADSGTSDSAQPDGDTATAATADARIRPDVWRPSSTRDIGESPEIDPPDYRRNEGCAAAPAGAELPSLWHAALCLLTLWWVQRPRRSVRHTHLSSCASSRGVSR